MTVLPDYEPPEELISWAFHFEPQIGRDGDGWVAHYPGATWTVRGASEAEALDKLKDEYARRQGSGQFDLADSDAVMLAHLREPIPGVYAMPNDLYRELRDRGADQAEFRRVFAECEARRANGESYTLADWLAEHPTGDG
ncbi:hypothetical protein [Mycobacterium kyorinense]|uniref:Uncharacterized protein n=1 Tax=Mycobacterium kyorinense TaxID=487514 RepID=A0A1X1XC11_9MYCO|nr:hypothetical protein [Mycobacterium kyorinense]ORV96220.1 hypothetical protein AWC14_16860 [Mycobacterium kyorinense]